MAYWVPAVTGTAGEMATWTQSGEPVFTLLRGMTVVASVVAGRPPDVLVMSAVSVGADAAVPYPRSTSTWSRLPVSPAVNVWPRVWSLYIPMALTASVDD